MTLANDGGPASNIARDVARATTERQWRAQLIRMALDEGWEINCVLEQHHYARRVGKGWPDLECLRERLVHIEAKTELGLLSEDQRHIIRLLKAAGEEVYVLRPSQEDEARRILHRRVRTP